jgi:ATP-dependent DNA helicase HFM1/MER3
MKDPSKFKLKLKEDIMSDFTDVELVDLTQDLEPISYAQLGPRDYRKLHTLHTSVQSDKTVRLPKKKPEFSYASGKAPEPPFLYKSDEFANIFDSAGPGDDEFPSPAALEPEWSAQIFNPIPTNSLNLREDGIESSSFPDASQASLEAGMLELADAAMIDSLSPKDGSSFANGVFDFDAYNEPDQTPEKSVISSTAKDILGKDSTFTPIVVDSLKRDRAATPELQNAKHRRVTKEEPVSHATTASVPDWVNEFDSDLINELKGFVDFVD